MSLQNVLSCLYTPSFAFEECSFCLQNVPTYCFLLDVKTVGVTATDAVMMACDSGMPEQPQDVMLEEMTRKLDLKDDFNISIPIEPLPEVQSDAVADNKVHEMADIAVIYATVEGWIPFCILLLLLFLVFLLLVLLL